MTTRSRNNHFRYAQYTKGVGKGVCEFCDLSIGHNHIVEEAKEFWVIYNLFPYDLWDASGVSAHLLVVPKRHVDSISHFNTVEQKEFVNILGKYEKDGYSVYARAPNNKNKSVIHQHTHLIKTDNKIKKFVLYTKKPKLLVTK